MLLLWGGPLYCLLFQVEQSQVTTFKMHLNPDTHQSFILIHITRLPQEKKRLPLGKSQKSLFVFIILSFLPIISHLYFSLPLHFFSFCPSIPPSSFFPRGPMVPHCLPLIDSRPLKGHLSCISLDKHIIREKNVYFIASNSKLHH